MTIKEIAATAGVSIGTVDRVLHNRGRVSPETRAKIMDIVKNSGYRKNLFASNLAGSSRHCRVGVFMPCPDQDDGYWQYVRAGLEKAGQELHGFRVETEYFFFDRYSAESFISCYADLRDSAVNGVIAAPAMSVPAEKCFRGQPLKVPQVFFDSDLNASRRIGFVGHDSFQGGRTAGKLMSLLIKNDSVVAIIAPESEGRQLNDRIAGFKAALAEYQPSAGIMTLPDIGPDVLSGDLSGLAGIFVCNASAHRYLESGVKIIGYDVTRNNLKGLLGGGIEFLISQNPEMQGYHCMHLLFRNLVMQEPAVNRLILPLDIVTRENLKYQLQEQIR